MKMVKLKQWYLSLIEKEKRSPAEELFYWFLCLLSFLYGAGVGLRNFLYDKNILPVYASPKKIVSIGNISWAGSGKTTLAIYLYHKLTPPAKTAILRRGYGADEGKLLKEETDKVFSCRNRVGLIRKLAADFDIFLLDDGFQYRKLKKDLNIAVMGSREFRRHWRLIPAYFFREPVSALRRADILILNYKEEINNPRDIKRYILNKFPHLKVYFADYRIKRISDLNNNEFGLDGLKDKKLAALAAIGYPQGFFNKLTKLNLHIMQEITYPDHYELGKDEFNTLAEELKKAGINGLITTPKDKYHLPPKAGERIDIFIMEIEMMIEEEKNFLYEVNKYLK